MDKIIRVNLTAGTITSEPVAEKYRQLGGRALTSQILLDEVDPAASLWANAISWCPRLAF
jgi:aldehyde:ferredoxin oxidoreductase